MADHPPTHCPHHSPSAVESQAKKRQLGLALLLIGGFAILELVVGLNSGSLVLIAESGHMASDSLALLLALIAVWLTQRTRSQKIAGNSAWEVIAALVNGLVLSAIALWIGWEALGRLQMPPSEIASFPMLITAILGTGVNGVNVVLLHRGSDHDLNLQAALLHVLADILSSLGVILAAILVTLFHWLWADGVVSLFVASLILFSSLPLLKQSFVSLLQMNQTGRSLEEVADVEALTTSERGG